MLVPAVPDAPPGLRHRQVAPGEPGEPPQSLFRSSFGRVIPGTAPPKHVEYHEHVGRTARPRHPGARLDGPRRELLRDRRRLTAVCRSARSPRSPSGPIPFRGPPGRHASDLHAGVEIVRRSGSLETRRRCPPALSRPRRRPAEPFTSPGPPRRQPASPATRSPAGARRSLADAQRLCTSRRHRRSDGPRRANRRVPRQRGHRGRPARAPVLPGAPGSAVPDATAPDPPLASRRSPTSTSPTRTPSPSGSTCPRPRRRRTL